MQDNTPCHKVEKSEKLPPTKADQNALSGLATV